MNDAGELIITGSFNGLLSRMAGLDYLGILQQGRKILKNAKRQKIEPTMRMSEMIQLTGMKKEDLVFFTSSCRLIEVVEGEDDPVTSYRHVHSLMRIFFRFVYDGMLDCTDRESEFFVFLHRPLPSNGIDQVGR
ncbi:hypothetical protein [Prosthecobacter sp.]|uniref:hypothetical protein n=1 Tax=Prosthecobacter sp. TaxID=1965333 RepID=UPI0037843C44